MTTITIPPLPAYPGPDASEGDLARFRAELDLYRAASDAVHAEAARIAAAAHEALSVRDFDDAGSAAGAKPRTRADVALQMAVALTQRPVPALSSSPAPASIANTATAIADALIALHPGLIAEAS